MSRISKNPRTFGAGQSTRLRHFSLDGGREADEKRKGGRSREWLSYQ